jgi:2'-5' RNA ligase
LGNLIGFLIYWEREQLSSTRASLESFSLKSAFEKINKKGFKLTIFGSSHFPQLFENTYVYVKVKKNYITG